MRPASSSASPDTFSLVSRAITRASSRAWRRSERSAWPTPGYCTFTATSMTWPPSIRHCPRCTWPIEAAAAGMSWKATSRSCQPGP